MTCDPEYHSNEDFQIRLQKLQELKQLAIDPFPHTFTPKDSAENLHNTYKENLGHSEEAAAGTTPLTSVAGRLVLFRPMGKNIFGQIQDHTGRIQIMFNRDLTKLIGYEPTSAEELSSAKIIEKKFDLGDIIGVEGHLFFTNKGELTIFVKSVTLLCKTLLPLADKHSGLADKELRYRKRWLDLISNLDIQKTFRLRSTILKLVRQYMDEHEFLEVETPVLQSLYGGAEARPFKTHLNALSQDMFLRISLEIPLKKLIVGGMNRIYEIGKVFRNEGIDRNHNPEFTLIEAYAAYWDYNDMMRFVENLFAFIATSLYGTTIVPSGSEEAGNFIEIDFRAPWKRMTMNEAIHQYGGYHVEALSDDEIKKILKESGHCDVDKLKSMSRGLLIAALFEVFAEPHLIQPHHIIDHPIETTPLCKLHRKPEQKAERIVERFESFILGQEICNSYSELNDPILQRELLVEQSNRRDAGDEEASPLDEEFIEAICQGMPPTGGMGIGIDRLVMLLLNQHSIRDVLYFPWMKPRKEGNEEEKENS